MTNDLQRSGSHEGLEWAEGNSAVYNAAKAQKEYRDERTPDQRKWDNRSYDIAELVRRLARYTADQMAWSRDPQKLRHVGEIVEEIRRELRALVVIGFREGDPVGPIPKLEPITTEVVKLSAHEGDAL